MKTMDYLERVRAQNGGCSDYRLAKLLDVRHSSLTNYTKHGREMDDDVALRVAGLLGLPPMRVVADIKAARAEADGQDVMFKFWREAAAMAGGVLKPIRTGGGMPATAQSNTNRRAQRGLASPARKGGALVAKGGIEPPTRGFSRRFRRRRYRRLFPKKITPARA